MDCPKCGRKMQRVMTFMVSNEDTTTLDHVFVSHHARLIDFCEQCKAVVLPTELCGPVDVIKVVTEDQVAYGN